VSERPEIIERLRDWNTVILEAADLIEALWACPRYDKLGSCVNCGDDIGHPRQQDPDCPVNRLEELTKERHDG